MSRYAKIETFIWHDDKFQRLTDDARMLFLYLLTSPHGNMCGMFYLPELYAASDLQWAPERYRRGIEALLKASRIAVDGNVIWLKNHVKHNTPRGKNQIVGFVNALEKVPSNSLIKEYVEDLGKHLSEEDYSLFKELYNMPLDIPLRRGSEPHYDTPSNTVNSKQLTDTVTDTASASGTEAQAPKKQDDDADKNINPEIIKSFAQTFGYPPNQIQLETLTSFIDDGLPDELILEALKRSAETGANSPRYTAAILQSWVSKSAFTLDDVRALDNLRQPRRSSGPVAREDFVYTEPQQDLSFFTFLHDDPEDDNDKIKEDSA